MIENPADRDPAGWSVLESVGARLEAFYWMFGKHDGIAVIEGADSLTMAGVSAAMSSTGAVHSRDPRTVLDIRHPAHPRDSPASPSQFHRARPVGVKPRDVQVTAPPAVLIR
jgi:hypothetical protein